MKSFLLGVALAALAPTVAPAAPGEEETPEAVLEQGQLRLLATTQDWQDYLAKQKPALRERFAPELARLRMDGEAARTVEDLRPVELGLDAWKKSLGHEISPTQPEAWSQNPDSVHLAQSQVEAFEAVNRLGPAAISPEQKRFLEDLKSRISVVKDADSLDRIFDNAGMARPAPLPETTFTPDGPAGMSPLESKGLAIRSVPGATELKDCAERSTMWQRAKSLLGIPYKFGGDSTWGMDCSAFVSRVWGVARHTTASMLDIAYPIAKDELQPGDALLLDVHKSQTGYGHIRLFAGWADPEQKEMWIYEEAGATGSAYKKVDYSSVYEPIRRKDLPRQADAPNATTGAVAATPASSAAGTSTCRPFSNIGCLYVPASARHAPTLAVYIRGHYGSAGGHVTGQANIIASARKVFTERGLDKAADVAGMPLLVTGSSDIGITASDISAAEAISGTSFNRIVLAAHSGGYLGLHMTLSAKAFPLERVGRVVMLDDFYSDSNLSPLQKLVGRGDFSCTGFYTAQSPAYVAQAAAYGKVCSIEKRQNLGSDSHDLVVNACLPYYLNGQRCP